MKTSDVPFLRGELMPESKTDTKTVAKPASTPPASPALTPAGEASDPAVHRLLAELETARLNGHDDDAQDIVGYLRELGYSAS